MAFPLAAALGRFENGSVGAPRGVVGTTAVGVIGAAVGAPTRVEGVAPGTLVIEFDISETEAVGLRGPDKG